MSDQTPDSNRNVVRLALAAALGSALGIITAVRTLSAGRQSAVKEQPVGALRGGVLPGADEDQIADPLERSPTQGTPTMQPATGRPDWERLPPAHLPRPTYWPVVLAFGIMLLAWGIVTTLAITVIGLVIFALGLGGWIGDLRHGDG